jgi:hypothetical protein
MAEISIACLTLGLAVGANRIWGANVRSPETYVGYRRAEHFASTQVIAKDSKRGYTP